MGVSGLCGALSPAMMLDATKDKHPQKLVIDDDDDNNDKYDMSKCSNDPYSQYLQDFLTVILLTQSIITNI